MERIQQFQHLATEKTQEHQKALDAKGYGHLGTGVAGVLMLLVFCPMSIVAIAAPYWTYSEEIQGNSVSAKASLWEVSVSMEINGASSESEISMCGDGMEDFDECGKIDAVRFFAVTALLLSLASAVFLLLGFSPLLKPTAALRRKMSIAGVSLAAVVLLWSFLAVCVTASIKMTDNYNLRGAGFVSLVLELFLVTLAIVLVVCFMQCHSSSTPVVQLHKWSQNHAREGSTPVVQIGVAETKKPQSQDAPDSPPTLLTAVGLQSQGENKIKGGSEDAPSNKEAKEVAPATNPDN